MGGDNPPEHLLSALAEWAPTVSPSVELHGIGHPRLKPLARSPLFFHSAPESIEMEDPPLLALRRKKQSSLLIGLRMLKEGIIDAFVSAGNTGALVSGAKVILSTFSGIQRPALLALMPTKQQPIAVLDVGANVSATADHLVQFAHLGAAYQRARGIAVPAIGLLNIGSEATKGAPEQKQAYKTLKNLPYFMGNIEGQSAFEGTVNVLVTDGFTGNVFLKTAEGVLDLLSVTPPQQVEFAGALLIGVNGLVVKCHGAASPRSFIQTIQGAIGLAEKQFLRRILQELSNEPIAETPYA